MTQFTFDDLEKVVPRVWLKDQGHVLFSGYRVLSPQSPGLTTGSTIQLTDAVVRVFWGESIFYGGPDEATLDFNADGMIQVKIPQTDNLCTTSQQGITLIAQSLQKDASLDQAQKRRQVICSLLSVAIGRRMTFTPLFENEIFFSAKPQRVGRTHGGLEVRPDLLISPYCSIERLSHFQTLDLALMKLDEPTRYRIEQALHWYDVGVRATGINAFINIWISLEALVLRSTSNIVHLKQCLGLAYNLPPEAANKHFGLGRIYAIRCSIFHGQSRSKVSIMLTSYLSEIFVDLLHQQLGLPCEERARQALNGNDFDSSDLLQTS